MKRYIYQETTDWGEHTASNHVYIFTEPPKGRAVKAIGYVKEGSNKVELWRTPYMIDLRNRTFRELA
jgi:hypothetical protein